MRRFKAVARTTAAKIISRACLIRHRMYIAIKKAVKPIHVPRVIATVEGERICFSTGDRLYNSYLS